MASHHRSISETTGKVYINPNFNKQSKNQTQPNTSMYINPNFNRQLQNHTLQQIPKSKIYVNPNFIKHTVTSNMSINKDVITFCKDKENLQNIETRNSTTNNPTTLPPTPISKSRYHLIRKNEVKVQQSTPKIVTNKIKINKYTIVAAKLNSVSERKDKLEPTPSTSKYTQHYKQVIKKSIDNVSSFEPMYLSKRNPSSYFNLTNKINSTPNRNRKPIRTQKNKVLQRCLKKNNIPCPQFRKYGKCLRKIQGNCEFLHDKKHVTICRMFLKGVCHNSKCLLSHDLTDKKMPTCYFYLNGMCTKEECPYLHIKLNEKTKVCVDFLKGYCEKGDQCLKRHMNICPELNQRGVCLKKICPYPHNKRTANCYYSKVKCKKQIVNVNEQQENEKNNEEMNNDIVKEKTISDCRYYTEQINETNESEIVLKPSRCKLGTLPSFIQL